MVIVRLTPDISAVSPPSAPVGSSVTISGSAFTGTITVTFNGVAATFAVVSDSTVTATAQTGALSGPLTVTTSAGSGTSPAAFGVIPKVSSFSPTSGKVGASVVISGSAFAGATTVTFNGAVAPLTVTSYSQATATVPAAASTGPIAVMTPGGTGVSPASFSVHGHH